MAGTAQAQSFLGSQPGPTFLDGPYVGAQLGYGMGNMELKQSNPFVPFSSSTDSLGPAGVEGGLLAGYGRTFGQIYLGGELDGTWNDVNGTSRTDIFGGSIHNKISNDWRATGSVRAGYMPTENLLLYGRLGASLANFNVEEADSAGGGSSRDTDEWGLTIGAGIEAAIAPRMSVRGEYRYTWYNDVDFGGGGTGGTVTPRIGEFLASLVYHF